MKQNEIREGNTITVTTYPIRQSHGIGSAVITLAAVLFMTACGGQPTRMPLSPTPVESLTAGVPITGLASPMPLLVTSALPSLQITASPVPTTPTALPAVTCQNPARLTPAVTEGPYFKANSPERTSLIDATANGLPLTLQGYVLTADCQPVAGALLDFWQANAQGQYDNVGYALRGHQFTDSAGRYQLETIVPGLYPGRTEHIHVKVQAPNGPLLTTQLFFPGVADNSSDQIYDPALLIQIQVNGSRMQATFDFVVNLR
jgi:protocatechuate 3,4-dioxygenase beta subunit